MSTIHLTDEYGDPILLNWDKVEYACEQRHDDQHDKDLRVFDYTRVHFNHGSVKVRQTVPEIYALLNAPSMQEQIDAVVTQGIQDTIKALGW